MRAVTVTPRRLKKAYNIGGTIDPNDPTQQDAIAPKIGGAITTGAGKLPQGSPGLTSALGAGSTLIGSVADALDKGNSHGRQSGLTTGLKQGASLAATGAAIGSAIPVVGTLAGGVIGGAIGLTEGLLGASSAAAQERSEDREEQKNTYNYQQQASRARVAGDPSLVYGNRGAQVFDTGGLLPPTRRDTTIYKNPNGQPLFASTTNPSDGYDGSTTLPNGMVAKWNRPATGPQSIQLLSKPLPPPIQSLREFQMGTPGRTLPNAPAIPSLYPSPNGVGNRTTPTPNTVHKTSYASGGTIHINPANKGKFNATKAATGKSTEELTHSSNPLTRKRAIFAQNAAGWNKKAMGGSLSDSYVPGQSTQVPGGSLSQMNSQSVQVNGQSHAQGGVQLPQAEVEGGETINNGFVFSKELGFADLHKPIAKAIGKIEAKPMNPVRRKSLDILDGRQQALMLSQEFLKQRMGIPSDLNS